VAIDKQHYHETLVAGMPQVIQGSSQVFLQKAYYCACGKNSLPAYKRGLPEHYASGDIFVYPRLTESYGNVTIEAMASGLASIAYDYAAARQHP